MSNMFATLFRVYAFSNIFYDEYYIVLSYSVDLQLEQKLLVSDFDTAFASQICCFVGHTYNFDGFCVPYFVY